MRQCRVAANWHVSLLLGALALSACGAEPEAPAPEYVRPARLYEVLAATSTRSITFPAVIQSARTAELTFQTQGEVVELTVLEGQEVAEGHIIARLDQRDVRNSLAQAQAEFANAEAEFRRAERLIAEEAISRSILDSRRTQMEIQRAALSVAEKAVDDTVLRAPFTGGVSRVFVEQFQNVQAKEPIIVLQSSTIEVVIDAPSTIVALGPRLEPANTLVELDVAPGIEIPAAFREATGTADEATQTYQITFTFDPPEGLVILPGMTATLRTTFNFVGVNDIAPDGYVVPLSAVLAEGDERFVWIYDQQTGTVSRQAVVLGVYSGTGVVVTEGLEGGETIVAAGVSYIHEGMRVQPWSGA
ncbi:MAG: efflux RND transporter periplasmic adaptor subunit [Pseudomonadota bacterium]